MTLTFEEAAQVTELIINLRQKGFPRSLKRRYGVFRTELSRIESYLKLRRTTRMAQILSYVNACNNAQRQPTGKDAAKVLSISYAVALQQIASLAKAGLFRIQIQQKPHTVEITLEGKRVLEIIEKAYRAY